MRLGDAAICTCRLLEISCQVSRGGGCTNKKKLIQIVFKEILTQSVLSASSIPTYEFQEVECYILQYMNE